MPWGELFLKQKSLCVYVFMKSFYIDLSMVLLLLVLNFAYFMQIWVHIHVANLRLDTRIRGFVLDFYNSDIKCHFYRATLIF